jgi:plastocyanin
MAARPSTWLAALAVPTIAIVAVVGTRVIEGPSGDSAATVAKRGANAVVIKNFAFAPGNLSVPKGTSLKVTNADGTAHTLTARDDSFNTGDLDGGQTTTVALKRSGTFEYYCKIHNYMTGTLVVK